MATHDFSASSSRSRGIGFGLIAVLLIALVLSGFVWFAGSSNPYSPPGYVGYLSQGAVLGHSRFYGLQNGPISPGRTWMLSVTNISITPYTYHEDFTGPESVLTKDNLNVGFRVHIVWRVHPDRVQDFVEKYSTLASGDSSEKVVEVAYQNFLKEPLRTYARDEIQKLEGLQIKDQITPIGDTILKRVLDLTRDTPFEVRSVVVGNIQYPTEVANAVSHKLAATQDLERRQIEIEIQKKEKEKRIVEAEGIARATEIINQQLTTLYIQHEAIEAQKAMVNSPNHTTIYIPVGPMGVPVVATTDAAQSTQLKPKRTDPSDPAHP